MKILIADSGSTKTDWALTENGLTIHRMNTSGINPTVMSESAIAETLDALPCPIVQPDSIMFYGAGCQGNRIDTMKTLLKQRFPSASKVEVASDLLAAAHALCQGKEGIACILGTGANSGLYDGQRITQNIPPLGYILGDEGSGAVLGRMFLNALFKERLNPELKAEYLDWAGMTYTDIIDRVYRQPMANRFLASVSPFIGQHIHQPELRELVKENFRLFFRNNVARYNRPELPVGAIGSMAWHYREILCETASEEHFRMGTIAQSPMEGLINYLSTIH